MKETNIEILKKEFEERRLKEYFFDKNEERIVMETRRKLKQHFLEKYPNKIIRFFMYIFKFPNWSGLLKKFQGEEE